MAATQLNRRPEAKPKGEVPPITWDPATRKVTPYRPRVLTAADIDAIAVFLRGLSVGGGATGQAAEFKSRADVATSLETDSNLSANRLY
ncbi:hypothetical protein [Roseibium sp.]|uniref:hypothetical protein n=1 Tax=Roseibium sp. TaxID=1936156 RepID=UPI003A98256F